MSAPIVEYDEQSRSWLSRCPVCGYWQCGYWRTLDDELAHLCRDTEREARYVYRVAGEPYPLGILPHDMSYLGGPA